MEANICRVCHRVLSTGLIAAAPVTCFLWSHVSRARSFMHRASDMTHTSARVWSGNHLSDPELKVRGNREVVVLWFYHTHTHTQTCDMKPDNSRLHIIIWVFVSEWVVRFSQRPHKDWGPEGDWQKGGGTGKKKKKKNVVCVCDRMWERACVFHDCCVSFRQVLLFPHGWCP